MFNQRLRPPFTSLCSHVFCVLAVWWHWSRFFCNENAKFTQSLLRSRFIKLTGECKQQAFARTFTIHGENGSNERFLYSLVWWRLPTEAHIIENKQTNRSQKGANDDAMHGVHSNRKSREWSLFFLLFTANDSPIAPITFTHSLRSRELWPLSTGFCSPDKPTPIVFRFACDWPFFLVKSDTVLMPDFKQGQCSKW